MVSIETLNQDFIQSLDSNANHSFRKHVEIPKSDPIQEILDSDLHTVDTMCHCLDLCYVQEDYDQVCHLFPLPTYANENPTRK